MRHWNDLPLGIKLAAGFGLTLALMAGLSLRAVWGLHDLRARFVELIRLEDQLREIGRREAAHLDWSLELTRALVASAPTGGGTEVDARACRFGLWFYGEGRRALERTVPLAAPLAASLEAPHEAVHRASQAMRRESVETARTRFREEFLPEQERFRALLGRLEDLVHAQGASLEREVEARLDDHRRGVVLFAGAALACGLIMAVVIARGVVAPLGRLGRAAGLIARGELDGVAAEVALDLDRQDEIGGLNRSFSDMTRALQEAADRMRRVAEGDLTVDSTPRSGSDLMAQALADLLTLQRELAVRLREAVGALTSAMGDIAASSAHLSQSAEETAAAVSQTTAVVEQIKLAARTSSGQAAQMAQTARQAAEVARQGVRSTTDLRETMALVSRKMDLSAQDVVRLNEKTRRIGQVVSIVSALADRSAILAVNGSIEAAKTGDESHGFQVVADEIKTLAVESKQAAAQVRWLLQDIQKAAGSVAMAAEEGGKAVVGGLEQSTQAERSIVELADHAAEGARAAAHIAATSAEELQGLSQAVQAMDSVRLASARNMDSARQLAESVRGLEDISQTLDALIRRYVV